MGLISAGINLKAQREANKTNLQIAQETNELNRYLAEQQNEWNLQQWYRENAYNDPAAQAGRLRNAGLSAAAAAQQVDGGNAAHLESANLANQQAARVEPERFDFNLAQDALNLITSFGGAANAMKAFKEVKFSDDLLMTKLDAEKWAVELTKQQYLQNEESFPHQRRQIKAQADSATWRASADKHLEENTRIALETAKINRSILQKQLDWFDKNSKINYDKAVAELHNLEKTGKNLDVQGDNLVKQGEQIDAQTQNIKQSTSNAVKQGEQIDAQTQNIKDQNSGILSENRIKEVEAILKENGYPESFQERIAILMQRGQMSTEDLIVFMKKVQTTQDVGSMWNDLDPKMKKYFTFVFDIGSSSVAGHPVGGVGASTIYGIQALFDKLFGPSREVVYPLNPDN